MDKLKLGLLCTCVVLLVVLGYTMHTAAVDKQTLDEKLKSTTTELTKTQTELQRISESKSEVIIVEKPGGEKITYKTREKRVVEQRVVYKDRIVEKLVEKRVVETVTVPAERVLSRYMVGASAGIDVTTRNRVYGGTAGARLGNLPLFIEGGLSSDKKVSVGLKFEF